jgi:hypothetical protein
VGDQPHRAAARVAAMTTRLRASRLERARSPVFGSALAFTHCRGSRHAAGITAVAASVSETGCVRPRPVRASRIPGRPTDTVACTQAMMPLGVQGGDRLLRQLIGPANDDDVAVWFLVKRREFSVVQVDGGAPLRAG